MHGAVDEVAQVGRQVPFGARGDRRRIEPVDLQVRRSCLCLRQRVDDLSPTSATQGRPYTSDLWLGRRTDFRAFLSGGLRLTVSPNR